VGESKGAEVSRKTGQESQTQNECSSEGKNSAAARARWKKAKAQGKNTL